MTPLIPQFPGFPPPSPLCREALQGLRGSHSLLGGSRTPSCGREKNRELRSGWGKVSGRFCLPPNPLDSYLDKEKATVGFPIISPWESHVPPCWCPVSGWWGSACLGGEVEVLQSQTANAPVLVPCLLWLLSQAFYNISSTKIMNFLKAWKFKAVHFLQKAQTRELLMNSRPGEDL